MGWGFDIPNEKSREKEKIWIGGIRTWIDVIHGIRNIKNAKREGSVSELKWLPDANTTRERMRRFGSPKEIWEWGPTKLPLPFFMLGLFLRFQNFQTLHIKSWRSP
ncbi:Uncharacterized protein TCM_010140 [Theobroma cacao]|uniref:Uncharacterized protein n=1 Tax=Theobroma cacao TaxID=3641 RepID=A0A061E7H3_THECC|nr:Uncharacterized protein TCM_010140 [Theobroma cacao]